MSPTTRPAQEPLSTSATSSRQLLRSIRARHVVTVLGILVPMAFLVWYAARSTVTFDGAMNLQVARNVANGSGYRWDYAARELFPAAIQTSGPYIFVAAAFIKVFGSTNLAFQAANLVFLLLLLVAVSVGLRHWVTLRVIGPSIVLFCVPGALASGLGGYGEMVIAALAIATFVLLDLAATSARRPVLMVAGASFLLGVALTVKIVAAMAVPVLLLGVVLVALLRHEIRWPKFLLGLSAIVPPLVLFEIYRWISLRGDYLAWWREQSSAIGYQAGVDDQSTVPAKHGLAKMAEHLHILATNVDVPAELLGPLLALPFVVLVLVLATRRPQLLARLQDRGVVLLVLASVYAGGYLAWWLAITPTEKAWLRRIAIGLVALALACLLLVGIVSDGLRRRPTTSARPRALFACAGALTAATVILGVVVAVPTTRDIVNAAGDKTAGDKSAANLSAAEDAGAAARALANEGATLYGWGWWSAPAVSLYGDVPLRDLSAGVQPCDVASQDAYLVWDWYAINIVGPVPHISGFKVTRVPSSSTPFASIFRLQPDSRARCTS